MDFNYSDSVCEHISVGMCRYFILEKTDCVHCNFRDQTMNMMNEWMMSIELDVIGGRWHMTEMNGEQFWMCKCVVALI